MGSAVPLDEEETPAKAQPQLKLEDNIGGTDKSPLQDHESEIAAELDQSAAAEGLSLLMKLGLGAVLIAGCYAWIRARSPRSSRSNSGRHGAYEKAGSLA